MKDTPRVSLLVQCWKDSSLWGRAELLLPQKVTDPNNLLTNDGGKCDYNSRNGAMQEKRKWRRPRHRACSLLPGRPKRWAVAGSQPAAHQSNTFQLLRNATVSAGKLLTPRFSLPCCFSFPKPTIRDSLSEQIGKHCPLSTVLHLIIMGLQSVTWEFSWCILCVCMCVMQK